LAVLKRGRWCIVGKIVDLEGEPILATAIRHQHGTATMVSMPVLGVQYAEQTGATWWYYRNDKDHTMRCIRLADLRSRGWWRDGELYVPLADMRPVAWRAWAYVEEPIVRLRRDARNPLPDIPDIADEPLAEQLSLFGGAP
jgi:hypothetical protein